MNKKIIGSLLAIILSVTSLYSSSYFGIESGSGTESMDYKIVYYDVSGQQTDTFSEDRSYSDFVVKYGFGEDGKAKFEYFIGNVSYTNDDEKYTNNAKGYSYNNKLSGMTFGMNIIKEFEITTSLYPYVRVGGSFGGSQYWTMYQLNIGGGLNYKLNDWFNVYLGIDHSSKSTKRSEDGDIDFDSTISSSGLRTYIGLNFTFGGDTEAKLKD